MRKIILLSLLFLCSCSSNNIDLEEFNNQDIKVYIGGAVINEGYYNLKVGDTLEQLIDLAHLSNEADETLINRLMVLKDGDNIYIPFINYKDERISLNFANETDLCKIPGIGIKTAQKIIEYREINGFFQNIEDIKRVKGIGDKKYEKMKEYIKL